MADVWLENVWVDGVWVDGIWVDESEVDGILGHSSTYGQQIQQALVQQLEENIEPVDYNNIKFQLVTQWDTDESPTVENFVFKKFWKNVVAEAYDYHEE